MTPLHHIALGARNVEKMARFYGEVFELIEVDRHFDEDGRLRSVWLDMEGPILMIERSEERRQKVDGVGAGPFLLAMSIAPEERDEFEQRLEDWGSVVEERTDYTSYARDPEGHRVAVSHYPVVG